MVKVKVKQPYKDLQKKLLFHKDETHEVSEARAAELEKKGLVEIIKTPEKTTKNKE